MGEVNENEIIGMDLSLIYGGILLVKFLWWNMLAKLIASIPLLTNGSGRNDRFLSSWHFTVTGLKISKMVATSLYYDKVGSETGV